MRVVGEDLRQRRVGALVEPLDRRQRRANEERLQHHVVPAILGEILLRKRAAMRDRLEDRAHRGAQPFAHLPFERRGLRIERQATIERDRLANLGCAAKRHRRPRRNSLRARGKLEQRQDAGGLVDRPEPRIPVLRGLFRRRRDRRRKAPGRRGRVFAAPSRTACRDRAAAPAPSFASSPSSHENLSAGSCRRSQSLSSVLTASLTSPPPCALVCSAM